MAVTQIRAVPSVRDTVTEAEWEARVTLAAAYRLVAVYGMTDMIANHISSCVPGEEGRFLINPYGLLYTEITASSLVKVDLDGNIVGRGDTDLDINRAGYVIHSAIHAARHDVGCVVHTHTPAGMAVSALECGLLPMTQTATRWPRIAYHSFEGLAIDLAERESLVRDLGDAEVMILRNHGLLACGASVPEAFNSIYRLELACKAQLMAMACNSPWSCRPTCGGARAQPVAAGHHAALRRSRMAGHAAPARRGRSVLQAVTSPRSAPPSTANWRSGRRHGRPRVRPGFRGACDVDGVRRREPAPGVTR